MKSAFPLRSVSGLGRAGLLSLIAGCGLMWGSAARGATAASINPGTDPTWPDPDECKETCEIKVGDTCCKWKCSTPVAAQSVDLPPGSGYVCPGGDCSGGAVVRVPGIPGGGVPGDGGGSVPLPGLPGDGSPGGGRGDPDVHILPYPYPMGGAPDGGGSAALGSFLFRINCGRCVQESGTVSGGKLYVEKQKPTSTIFSPQSLQFEHNFASFVRTVKTSDLPEGVARQVTISRPNGKLITYSFAVDASVGTPQGREAGYDNRLRMTNANGEPVTADPTYYERYDGAGNFARFDAQVGGQIVFIRTATGRTVTMSDPGVNIVIVRGDQDLLRQIRTSEGLADIVTRVLAPATA